jgi:hypothetical protein
MCKSIKGDDMNKLWIGDKIFLVDEEVHDEIERLTALAEVAMDKMADDRARIAKLEAALSEIASAANYTAPEDIEARLHNEEQVYAIARAALEAK